MLNCPHIVGYIGYDITTDNGKATFDLMMEYACHGTVSNEIRTRGGSLDEATVRYLTRQILQGVDYLHSRGIVHCDIKGSNILLTEHGVKLVDFGCAKGVYEPVIGFTPMFMAPEVARCEQQGCPADIWAVGCTIIEMFTGRPPMLVHWISECSHEIPTFLSDEAKDFLIKCLRVDPRERWTAAQLLNHPFLDGSRVPEFEQVVKSSHTDSPTSILDEGIWRYGAEEECSQGSDDAQVLSSPLQRMQELALSSARMMMSRWEACDSWITVRQVHNINFDDHNLQD